ncbi:hypothetical protein IAU60_000202 [Kwoniella sp. DSM 27419]
MAACTSFIPANVTLDKCCYESVECATYICDRGGGSAVGYDNGTHSPMCYINMTTAKNVFHSSDNNLTCGTMLCIENDHVSAAGHLVPVHGGLWALWLAVVVSLALAKGKAC